MHIIGIYNIVLVLIVFVYYRFRFDKKRTQTIQNEIRITPLHPVVMLNVICYADFTSTYIPINNAATALDIANPSESL